MAKVVTLHEVDALVLPLAEGASLRVTRFLESARVALTVHGPSGGDAGGVLLGADRARLLGSWLLRMADLCGSECQQAVAGRAQVVRLD